MDEELDEVLELEVDAEVVAALKSLGYQVRCGNVSHKTLPVPATLVDRYEVIHDLVLNCWTHPGQFLVCKPEGCINFIVNLGTQKFYEFRAHTWTPLQSIAVNPRQSFRDWRMEQQSRLGARNNPNLCPVLLP